MSTFYGSLEGEKKRVTKMGQRRIADHIRGWDHGIKVVYFLDEKNNAQCFVYQTGGSNNPKEVKTLLAVDLGSVSRRRPGYTAAGGIGNL